MILKGEISYWSKEVEGLMIQVEVVPEFLYL